MSIGRVLLLIFGVIGILISIGLLMGGGAILLVDNTIKDSQGFYTTKTIQIEKDSYAIVTGPADIDIEAGWDKGLGLDLGDLATFKVTGKSNDSSKQLFIGIATELDIEAYLGSVQYDEVTNIHLYPYSVDYQNHPGNIVPGAPTSQIFWTSSTFGAGTQSLEWGLETGSHSLVLMNSDGSSDINISIELGAKIPWLLGVGIGLLVGGGLALAIGSAMIFFAVRRQKTVSPEPSETRALAENESIANYKPGVLSSYGNGWRQLWKYFLELLLITIIVWLISLPAAINETQDSWIVPVLGLFAIAYTILIEGPIGFGASFAFLKAARGDKVEIKDMFKAFKNYLNAVFASLLVGVIVVFGLVLLIVPGIIFACKLAFTPYLVVDRKMEVIEAIKTSWRMTDGYAWDVFFIGLLAIPIGIAGLLALGVGVIVSVMWVGLAFASLYHVVSTSTKAPKQV